MAVVGLALAFAGLWFLLPQPSHFALGGRVVEVAGHMPVPDATIEAHDDATSDRPSKTAKTDDRGAFYLNYNKEDEGRYVRLRVTKDTFAATTRYTLIKIHSDTLTFELTRTPPDVQPSSGSPSHAIGSEAALNFMPLRSASLVAWISSRPEFYSPKIATAFARDFPDGKLVERDIPPTSFVDRVLGTSVEPPPDIAFIDNYFQLEPLLRARLVWGAWGVSRFPVRGWWVIFKDTKHVSQAQAFMRWLNRAPGWQPRARNISISSEAIHDVQEVCIAAAQRTLSGDQPSLDALLDRAAARSRLDALDASARIGDIQPILTFGNSRIAFVLLAVLASGENFYGMRHMTCILRNQEVGWRILQMDPNAMMPDGDGAQGMNAAPTILRSFDQRIVGDEAELVPPAAVLIDPPDRARLPRFPARPDIAWRSEAASTSNFIVESQFSNPQDETDWSVSNLSFAEALRGTQPFKEQAPFGVGMQPHRWRVWTLGRSGSISLRPWRTVIYTN